MRFLLLLFILVQATHTHGQHTPSYSSFTIADKEVVWSQVYHAPARADTLADHLFKWLKRKAWVRNLLTDGNDLVAEIDELRVDYKRYGGKYLNTSHLIRTGRWSGRLRVSFKDEKYRVVVYGLAYDARQPAMHAGKMSNEAHAVHGTWTDWVLNKYRTRFRAQRHTNMDIMHAWLKDCFTLKETELIDADW